MRMGFEEALWVWEICAASLGLDHSCFAVPMTALMTLLLAKGN